MYIPKHFAETDLAALHGLVCANPLATWVMFDGSEFIVNHVPFLLDSTGGEYGTLRGHVARANPAWQAAKAATPSLLIFRGPDAYISPTWYASKHEHGKAVPTWNYAVVHAYGSPSLIEDREWLLQHLTALSEHHESLQAKPWQVSDAPADYIDKMLGNIVGIEIPISKLEGKFKLGQNRSMADQQGVLTALDKLQDPNAQQLSSLLRDRQQRG